MKAIRKTITLSPAVDLFVMNHARRVARSRGSHALNFSAAVADLIIAARNHSLNGKHPKPNKEAAV